MSIYTRRGDSGETSLADGSRVRKDSARVEAYGTVDEANSAIGLARAVPVDERLDGVLRFAQHRLFNCSASLAAPGGSAVAVTAEDVAALEAAIDGFEAATGAPGGFVIEGGCEAAARLQVARAVVRRAERRVATLAASEPVDPQVTAFINRLSDALFAGARYANALTGTAEELWSRDATPEPEID